MMESLKIAISRDAHEFIFSTAMESFHKYKKDWQKSKQVLSVSPLLMNELTKAV